MNDSRDELSPYWLQTTSPFGMTPQSGAPDLGWGFPPTSPPPLVLWDWTRLPMPMTADWPAVPVSSTGGILGDLGLSNRSPLPKSARPTLSKLIQFNALGGLAVLDGADEATGEHFDKSGG